MLMKFLPTRRSEYFCVSFSFLCGIVEMNSARSYKKLYSSVLTYQRSQLISAASLSQLAAVHALRGGNTGKAERRKVTASGLTGIADLSAMTELQTEPVEELKICDVKIETGANKDQHKHLNIYHSYFVLVDDFGDEYGCEIPFRGKLEEYLAHQCRTIDPAAPSGNAAQKQPGSGKIPELPIVTLVIQGGKGTLE